MSEIDHLVSSAAALYQNAFRSLAFLEPKPRDLLVACAAEVSAVRVELQGRSCLHFHSIELADETGERLQVAASVEASSCYGAGDTDTWSSRVLDWEGSHSFAIHTAMEDGPWVQVNFAEPVVVQSICLRNRAGPYARRAAGMLLSVLVAGEWVRIYDDEEEARRLASTVGRLVNRRSPVLDALKATAQVVGAGLSSRYEGMDRVLASHHLPAAEISEIKRAINKHVLFERELEWTSHGIRRSFRFWSAREASDYVALAVRVCNDLRSVSLDACFGFGSVLALVRDGTLIKHDDDLDVVVALDLAEVAGLRNALDLVKDALVAKGYRVQGNFLSHWHVFRDGKKVDVFVGLFEKDGRIGWFPGRRRAFSRDDVFPPRFESFLGCECPIPKNAEGYLQELYGPNWRLPIPGWKHDWDRSAYLDLL